MARLIGLHASPWQDCSLHQLAAKAAEWGYQALELEVGSSHVPLATLADPAAAAAAINEALAEHELQPCSLGMRALGQAVGDELDARHQAVLPVETWGDGEPEGVRQRAVDAVVAGIRLARQLDLPVVTGFMGSTLGRHVFGYPPSSRAMVQAALEALARRWQPVLDVCREVEIPFALQLDASQAAFDLYGAEMLLEALGGREEFGFALDPATLHWQGVDPAAFVRRFRERILQVRIVDAAVMLNGSSGILGSCLPQGDWRRGWEHRSPGRGGVDWEALFRALHAMRYAGTLVVECRDPAMDRDASAAEAYPFVTRMDFEPVGPPLDAAFDLG